jgi:hypothetical protein
MATWNLLYACLLLNAIGHVASAQDVRVRSAAVTTRIRVDIVVAGQRMPPTLEAVAMHEASLIWAPYGVDLNTPTAGDCRRDNAIRLTVTFGNGPALRTAPGTLGSIRFTDGMPEPAIVMYPHVVAALVSATPIGSLDSPSALRDRILGRVLGRALAHEIGHFLLRSRLHSADGLMRAVQPINELIAPNRREFGLSAEEIERLTAMTPQVAPDPLSGGDCPWRGPLAE